MSEAPKIPTPDAVMAVTNKHVAQTLEVLNAQVAEASTTLGTPAPPALPKFAPPALPKMSGGLPQLPFVMPFQTTAAKKGEETIVKTEVPTPQSAKVLA